MRAIRPASRAVRGHDAREVQPLVGGVVVAADRPEPVEHRQARRRGRVGVARPAGRRVVDAKPSSPAIAVASPTRRARRPGALHGRVAAPLGSARRGPRRASGSARCAPPRPRPASNSPAVAARTSTSIRQRCSHHVRARAALDHADVDRHARPAAVQGVQRDHLVRCLEDRAAPLLGLDAGVRGPAGDRRSRSRRSPCGR